MEAKNSSAKAMWVFLNDRFVPHTQALVSVFDYGFLYGDGVFETLRAYDTRIFLLERHLTRFSQASEMLGITPPPRGPRQWLAIFHELLYRNRLRDALIRLTLSRGSGEPTLDPSSCCSPTTVAFARPLRPSLENLYQSGVRIVVARTRRNAAATLLTHLKSLNYLDALLAKQEALQAGAFDGLMLNSKGWVAECSTSNIFFVQHGCLYTPSVGCGIFPGLTREVVLTVAQEYGVPVQEGMYPLQMLLAADECFLTNTGFEILPVHQLGTTMFPAPVPGPVTKYLQQGFRAYRERELTHSPHGACSGNC
ncbi:MAG: branched-chain amino acid aminotransferase [Nitrospirae bacterium]|nr:MAG: branched-chain amino acid aminotransferase [Nitrospirota bacterium]